MNINKRENYKLSRRLAFISLEQEVEQIEKLLETANDEEIKNNLLREISHEEILTATSNVSNFIFELTRQCNFRCKYCSYGGEYLHTRNHEHKSLEYKTITKGIDFIFKLVNSKERTKTRRDIYISFYGGEALLQFETILQAINYARSHHLKKSISPRFIVSTNGYLLTPDIAKTLINEDVDIHISIDGPQNEHDKFRILENGNGTWNEILNNISFIKNNFPEFFEKKMFFLATIHPNHDIRKIERFFLKNNHLFNNKNVTINKLKLDFLANEAKEKSYQKKRKEQNDISLDKNQWFYQKWKYGAFPEILKNYTRIKNASTTYTATCFPGGTRLYFDANGKFQICEKINNGFSIGDITIGFDFKQIKSIIEAWNRKQVELECWKCEISWFCMFCFAPCGVDGAFQLTKEDCAAHQDQIKSFFNQYIEDMEEAHEEGDTNNHTSIANTLFEL